MMQQQQQQQVLSLFTDENFFQDLLMTVPHRQEAELYHTQHKDLPPTIQFFAFAVSLLPSIWRDMSAVQSH